MSGPTSVEMAHPRLLALVAATLMGVVAIVLTSCGDAPADVLAAHAAAASARRVGMAGATPTAIACALDQERSPAAGRREVRSTCRNRIVVCCSIEVSIRYHGDQATSEAAFDASRLMGRWHRSAGRWFVSCSWTRGPTGWSMRSCQSPDHRQSISLRASGPAPTTWGTA